MATKKSTKVTTSETAAPAASNGKHDPATSEIRWTAKKIACLATLRDLKATSATTGVTVEEMLKASKGTANRPAPAFDVTVQGYLAWASLEGERHHRIYVTKKGLAMLAKLEKAAAAPAK